jgi:hypothetical protein
MAADELDRTRFRSSSIPAAEIVVGVVTPVGTDVDFIERTLTGRADHFAYAVVPVRLSDLIRSFRELRTEVVETPYGARLHSLCYQRTSVLPPAGRWLRG